MFNSVREIAIPDDAQICKIVEPSPPSQVDCFTLCLSHTFNLTDYIEAFYTSPVFKLERKILSILVRKHSTDAQAKALAYKQCSDFSAWRLEYRDDEQTIMGDFLGRTKSWLMVKHPQEGVTQLYFGTAVMPVIKKDGSITQPSALFSLLGGFHRMYSRILLNSARKVLLKKKEFNSSNANINSPS